MQPTLACPLAVNSRFCLSSTSVQRNSNASTNLRALDESEELPTSEGDGCSVHLDNSNQAQFKEKDSCFADQYANFSAVASGSRSKQGRSLLQKNRQQHLRQRPDYLIPLALSSNQSNFFQRFLGNNCKNVHNVSEQPQPPQKPAANSVNNVPARGGGELMPNSGVPYWNVYEYHDFRQVDSCYSHMFDPQVEPCWHRETIIQDCYNRLRVSTSKFRPPPPYHLR